MRIQAIAAVIGPRRQVDLPNALERKLINIVGGTLPSMVLVGPNILQVKQNAAIRALGHASLDGQIGVHHVTSGITHTPVVAGMTRPFTILGLTT